MHVDRSVQIQCVQLRFIVFAFLVFSFLCVRVSVSVFVGLSEWWDIIISARFGGKDKMMMMSMMTSQ